MTRRRNLPKQITQEEQEAINETWWQEVIRNPQEFDKEAIAHRIHLIQIQDFKKYGRETKAYYERRTNYFIDCDKSSDCQELDNWHQELRSQFQQKYNKDIKHG